jgi:phosphate-selective porin OprO/OprP
MSSRSLRLAILLLVFFIDPALSQQVTPVFVPPGTWPANNPATQAPVNQDLAVPLPPLAVSEQSEPNGGSPADSPNKTMPERVDELERELQKMKDAEKKKKDEDAKRPSIKVRGRIQTDAAMFSQDPASRAAVGDLEDGSDYRRARLGAQGQAFQVTEYMFEMDFAGGDIRFTDVFVQVIELPILGSARAGHYYEPFSLEQLTSDNYITFLERSLANSLSTDRNWGLASFNHNEEETVTWGYGVFRTGSDDAGEDVGDDGERSVTARMTWLPYYDEPSEGRYLWHFGGAYSFRDADEDLVRFAERPEVRMSAEGEGSVPPFVDTGSIPAHSYDLYGAEAAWVNGPLSVQSELIATRVDAVAGDPLFFYGAYGFVSYFLTGESRPYRRTDGTIDRVNPYGNFFCVRTGEGICKGPGAWEAVARLSYLDFDDGLVTGGQLLDTTLGLNWYLNTYVRVQFNYIHAELDRLPFGETSADIFAVRFHAFW